MRMFLKMAAKPTASNTAVRMGELVQSTMRITIVSMANVHLSARMAIGQRMMAVCQTIVQMGKNSVQMMRISDRLPLAKAVSTVMLFRVMLYRAIVQLTAVAYVSMATSNAQSSRHRPATMANGLTKPHVLHLKMALRLVPEMAFAAMHATTAIQIMAKSAAQMCPMAQLHKTTARHAAIHATMVSQIMAKSAVQM
jgi:hypothetical protein